MNFYSIISKTTLLCISVMIILYSVLIVKTDLWPLDLFYFLSLFTSYCALDFLFYQLHSKNNLWKRHSLFCSFPITRKKIFLNEMISYIKRWELIIFIVSILFFISYFYLLNRSEISGLISILILYLFQLLFLYFVLFAIKSIINEVNSDETLKSWISCFVSIVVILAVYSDKIKSLRSIFLFFPFSHGLLSNLVNKNIWFLSCASIGIIVLILSITINKRFRRWPLL